MTKLILVCGVLTLLALNSIARFKNVTVAQSKPPEMIVLADKAALGKVTFSHLNHTQGTALHCLSSGSGAAAN